MTSPAARLAAYRLRTTLRRRLAGYIGLALMAGLVGGIALAAMTAARRTDSSYPDYLASTTPSGLVVEPFTSPAYSPAFVSQLRRLPHVRAAAAAITFNAATLTPRGGPGTILLGQAQLIASPDGLYSRQDRVTIIAGRAASARRPDEVVASPDAAALLGLHVGSHLRVGIVSSGNGQVRGRVPLIVTGIGVFNLQVLQDDVDAGRTGFLLGTPALAARFASCCSSGMIVGLRLADASRQATAVGREYQHLLATSPDIPRGQAELQVYLTSAIEAEAQRAIRPAAIALAAFAAIAGAAALLLGGQSIARLLRAGLGEAAVLRELGASPAAAMADGLLGVLGALIAAAVLAAGVAVGLSPFSLFGPLRAVEPGHGAYLDGTVLGLGTISLIAVLAAIAVVTSYRQAPRRTPAAQQSAGRGSAVVRASLGAGLGAAGVTGLRFALEPGRGRTAVPVRSVIAGSALTVVVGAATLTFGASLSTLISHPDLYGWDFSYAIYSVQGWGSVPSRWAGPLLASDRDVAATTAVYFTTTQVDGQTVPALLEPVRPAVAPRILSGHGLDGPHQMVLGPATLAQLHRRVGDIVPVNAGRLHVRLRIVGTATMPTIGTVLSAHPSMSTGALLPATLVPGAASSGPFGPELAGPNAIFVRLRPGVSQQEGQRSLHTVTADLTRELRSRPVLNRTGGSSAVDIPSLLPAQRPAEIVNYKTMGALPAILAGGLAAGAAAGLGLTLIASVRRRRRDLALLKILGFTRAQLAAAVAWQATITAAAGLLVGLPLGIAAGRWLWLAFARQLSVVPAVTVPAASLALIAAAALVLANLVAALPGRAAARTPAAATLRAE